MSEIEKIRARLYHALADGSPQEEILQVSRCLDAMIVAGMRNNLDNPCYSTACANHCVHLHDPRH